MRELPILFSTEMVKAILDGRKSMTRRVIKPQPDHRHRDVVFEYGKLNEYSQIAGVWHVVEQHKCPYGQPGDRLWVRETWCQEWQDPDGWTGNYLYRADGVEVADVDGGLSKSPWKPSIHMPKAAARIWLEVTDVRVERLQDINAADAKAEGIGNLFIEDCAYDDEYKEIPWNQEEGLAVHQFARLWDSINAKRGYGWDANNWVWVYSFKRIKP